MKNEPTDGTVSAAVASLERLASFVDILGRLPSAAAAGRASMLELNEASRAASEGVREFLEILQRLQEQCRSMIADGSLCVVSALGRPIQGLTIHKG